MRPETGGRVVLELVSQDETGARYRAELFTPAGEWSTGVRVGLADGAVDFEPFSAAGEPAWLVAFARAFLRSAWREHKEGEAWPTRITRWRAEPSR